MVIYGYWFITIVNNGDNDPTQAFLVAAAGRGVSDSVGMNSTAILPTFYITNITKIKGGTGTIDNPYIISQ